LSICCDYAPAHYNIGVVYSERGLASMGDTHVIGEFEEAMKYYHEAIKYDPKHAESYCNIGVIFKRIGNLRVCISACCLLLRKPFVITERL
jgi:tetratricopeptide (TPR) repeat protein